MGFWVLWVFSKLAIQTIFYIYIDRVKKTLETRETHRAARKNNRCSHPVEGYLTPTRLTVNKNSYPIDCIRLCAKRKNTVPDFVGRIGATYVR